MRRPLDLLRVLFFSSSGCVVRPVNLNLSFLLAFGFRYSLLCVHCFQYLSPAWLYHFEQHLLKGIVVIVTSQKHTNLTAFLSCGYEYQRTAFNRKSLVRFRYEVVVGMNVDAHMLVFISGEML